MMLEVGGLVFSARQVERLADSGLVLEVQLRDGNQLRFVGAEAQHLRTQLNLLLEELLRWCCPSPLPGRWSGYTWPSQAAVPMSVASPSIG